jgi:Hg(II)-responsive transcriptional regulator
MHTLTIGQLAKEAGVNVQTVRYYERRGLLPEPPRSESGYRKYPLADVGRIGFIRRAQGLGFTLGEVEELLSLRVDPGATPGDVRGRVEQKIAHVESKLGELERIHRALVQMASSCDAHGPLEDCAFMEALDAQPESGV